jgi:hypothetical protein
MATVFENIFRAIDTLMAVTNDAITATENCQQDVEQVLRALSQVNLGGAMDVVLLARYSRGTGAMKVARSMFEVSLTAQYLENHPAESQNYLDFVHVLLWRWAQNSPGKLTASEMQQADADYNRVKGRFTNSKGKVQNNWSPKTIKQMADEIGRGDLYDVAYSAASMLHHVNPLGLLAHEYDWVPEALRIAHGSLFQTVCSLYNVSNLTSTFAERFSRLKAEFEGVWAEHAAARPS